jgi:hypothetical protein
MCSAITKPKQNDINVLNIAVFRQNLCTDGNILPFSGNYFPIFLFLEPNIMWKK